MDQFIIHPGEILREEYLRPLELSVYRLAKETGLPQSRLGEIINGRRRITADTALGLAKYFKTTVKFWLNLQTEYDLRTSAAAAGIELSSLPDYQSRFQPPAPIS